MSNHTSYSFNGTAGTNTVFGRGRISEKTSSFTVGKGQFAIETDNSFLNAVLRNGVRIRVQHYYESDEMNLIETALGYHSIQRTGGKDVESTQSYDTQRYNRSIFGMKADGTYVLMTTDRNGYSGTTHMESNAILKYYGVTEAFQQDGGGSAMAIFRNFSGGFDIVNESSDTGTTQRSVLSGVFFAVYDPSYVASSPVLDISSNNPDDYSFPTQTIFYKSPMMSGSDVAWVQAALYQLGYTIEVDGKFGHNTDAVVRQYQTDRGLDVDGKVGPATRADIQARLAEISQSYTLSFDANGGTLSTSLDGSYVYGTVITLPRTKPTLTGYTFLGWAEDKNATSADYSAGNSYTVTKNVTLYAVWTPTVYTINFYANEGESVPEEILKPYNVLVSIPSFVPKRAGYNFICYKDYFTGTQYLPGDLYTANSDALLIAQWEKSTLIRGDVDKDQIVDELDSILLSRYIIGWYVEIDLDAGDVNGDGQINDWDSVILDRFLAGWIKAI